MIATESNGADRLDYDDQQLVDEFGETKIQAQHRWTREGIAEQAAAFRMKVRKKGQAAGLKRAERGLRAWRATMEKFATPERKYELAVLERFKLADVIRDRGMTIPGNGARALTGEISFADLWAAVHELLAEEFYWLDPPIGPDDESKGRRTEEQVHRSITEMLRVSLHSQTGKWQATRKAAIGWAIVDLSGFLVYAEESITRGIQR